MYSKTLAQCPKYQFSAKCCFSVWTQDSDLANQKTTQVYYNSPKITFKIFTLHNYSIALQTKYQAISNLILDLNFVLYQTLIRHEQIFIHVVITSAFTQLIKPALYHLISIMTDQIVFKLLIAILGEKEFEKKLYHVSIS